MANNPISEVLGELNEDLQRVGADFTVGAKVEVPAEVQVNDTTVKTHVAVEITEDGWEPVDADAQIDRIVQEIKNAVELE